MSRPLLWLAVLVACAALALIWQAPAIARRWLAPHAPAACVLPLTPPEVPA